METLPRADSPHETATAADGTHPTGMHSCAVTPLHWHHAKSGNATVVFVFRDTSCEEESICITSLTRTKLNDKMAFPT